MVAPHPSKDDPAWQDAEREHAFWQERADEFLQKYPDQFVAVRDGEVVAVAYDIRDLLAMLRARGMEPTEVWFRFFHTNPYAAL